MRLPLRDRSAAHVRILPLKQHALEGQLPAHVSLHKQAQPYSSAEYPSGHSSTSPIPTVLLLTFKQKHACA